MKERTIERNREVVKDKRGRSLRYLTLIGTILVPGSGYVFLGRPMRGLVMLFWMIIFGYLTYHYSSVDVSLWGRISGGIAVWVLSILEVYKMVINLDLP